MNSQRPDRMIPDRDDLKITTLDCRRVLCVFRCVLREPLTVQSGVHEEHNGRHDEHEENFGKVAGKIPEVQN